MKKNVSRLIVFCAVMLGLMLVGYGISFADIQSMNLKPAHFVPAEETLINTAVALKEQKLFARESTFEWAFLSAFTLLGSLLLVWALVLSVASKLRALPRVRVAYAQKQAVRYDKGTE